MGGDWGFCCQACVEGGGERKEEQLFCGATKYQPRPSRTTSHKSNLPGDECSLGLLLTHLLQTQLSAIVNNEHNYYNKVFL